MNINIDILLVTSLLYSTLSICSINAPFLIQNSVQVLNHVFNHLLLISPIWNSLSLVFMTLALLKVLSKYFVESPSNFVYQVLSWLDWNYVLWTRIFQKWCSLSSSDRKLHDTKECYKWWLLLCYIIKVMYIKLINYMFTVFSFLINKHFVGRYFETFKNILFLLILLSTDFISIDDIFPRKNFTVLLILQVIIFYFHYSFIFLIRNFTVRKSCIFPLFSYLFNYLFISVWTHGDLYYGL